MKDGTIKILLVDDEPDILEFLGYTLRQEGYLVLEASDGKRGLEIAKREKPDLVILDVMMPGMDGIETCRQIRNSPELKDTMVAFLTARDEDYSQIAGLEVGGDDYIHKPIKPRVLVSRIKAMLRRAKNNEPFSGAISLGGITIDKESYLIIKEGKKIDLPRREFELLSLLMSKPGKVFNRENILESAWGSDVVVGERTIDVHIRKLREKIGEQYIKTVKGIGYKFEF